MPPRAHETNHQRSEEAWVPSRLREAALAWLWRRRRSQRGNLSRLGCVCWTAASP